MLADHVVHGIVGEEVCRVHKEVCRVHKEECRVHKEVG